MSATRSPRSRGNTRRAVAWLTAAAIAACSGDSTTSPNPGSVSVTVAGSPVTIVQGQSGTVDVAVARTAPFSGAVALSLEGAPAGVTPTFDPASVASGATASTLTLAIASSATPGTYPLTIRAKGQGVTDATVALSLVVTEAPPPSFALALSPTSVSVAQGASVTSTATITRSNGFGGDVALAVTGAPAGVTVAPVSIPSTATSGTITVVASASATPGTYSLTVTGTGTGVANQTATLSLTVAAAQTGSFTLVLAPTTLSIAQGANATSTATITRAGGFAGAVTLAVTGAPTGVSVSLNPATGTTGNTVTIAVAASESATPGTYSLTVTGTGTNVATRTATIGLTVTAAQTGSFTLALSPTSVSVVQGASVTTTATVTRAGGFGGAVNLAVTGAPAGVTVAAVSIPGTATSATLTVVASASATPGTYSLTVTGTGSGVANKTATLSVTVTAAQAASFTLALSPTSVSVAQGASVTSTATVTRAGGFTGAVNLAVTGAPAGVTVASVSIPGTATTGTLTVVASSSAAVGTYSLTVTGTGTGVANKTATLSVQVTAGTAQTATFAFCSDDAPAWFAVQDGSGPWTHVTGTNNSFTFHFTSTKVGIAYVTTSATSGSDLTVVYATAAELQGVGGTTTVGCTSGGKSVNGSVANVGASELATISLASSSATVVGGSANTFQLTGLPQGTHDLIASRITQTISGSSISYALNRLIIRRNLDPANGSTLPVLDFAGSESFAPATANVTIGNLGSDQALAEAGLTTANGTSAGFFFSSPSTATTLPYYGVPDAKLATGDLHSLTVFATPPGSGSPSTSRVASLYFRSVTDRTVTLGSTLGVPTITTVATTPYLRLRAQLAAQSEYNRLAGIFYTQGSGASERSVSVMMTAAYAGTASYDLTIPDLSAASGWNNAWGLQPAVATNWTEIEAGGSFNFFFPGQHPTDGSTVLYATRSGTIASP